MEGRAPRPPWGWQGIMSREFWRSLPGRGVRGSIHYIPTLHSELRVAHNVYEAGAALRAALRKRAITAVQTLRAIPGSSRCARNNRRNPRGATLPAR